MADSGGHWKNLAEAQKLTQSTKIPGVFETDVKRNNPLERLPVAQASGTGLKIEWLREKTLTEDAVTEAVQGTQLAWADDVDYTEVETTIRYLYLQRKLDKYNSNIYSTYNNYRARVLLEMEKGLRRKLGDRIIYADTTYGGSPTQFDGLHALAAERGASPGGDLNIDMGDTALSLATVRTVIDAMKLGVDEIWVSKEIGIRFDQAYEEAGFTSLAAATAGALSLMTKGFNTAGQPITQFMGIPIIRTDYLVGEGAGTGTGASSNARTKTGSTYFSMFFIKYGNPMAEEPGLGYGYGSDQESAQQGDFYSLDLLPRLENYNAEGFRMNHYGSILLGSPYCLGRIFDITDAAITA